MNVGQLFKKKRRGRPGAPVKYPFEDLEIGEEFFVLADDLPVSGPASVRSAMAYQEKKLNRKFNMRVLPFKDGGGVKVWREE